MTHILFLTYSISTSLFIFYFLDELVLLFTQKPWRGIQDIKPPCSRRSGSQEDLIQATFSPCRGLSLLNSDCEDKHMLTLLCVLTPQQCGINTLYLFLFFFFFFLQQALCGEMNRAAQ